MNRFFAVLVIILVGTAAHAAPPKSLAGLWVATDNDTAYWLRVSVSSPDSVALIEDVSGTLTTRSAGSTPPTTTPEVAVTGQYLPHTRVAALNFGEPTARRQYAIGIAPEDRTGYLVLTVFRLRPGQGINYERQVSFKYKGPLPEPTTPVMNEELTGIGTPELTVLPNSPQ